MDIQRVQVGSLVFDDKLVEIRPINTVFVSRYRQAMRQGSEVPASYRGEKNAHSCQWKPPCHGVP